MVANLSYLIPFTIKQSEMSITKSKVQVGLNIPFHVVIRNPIFNLVSRESISQKYVHEFRDKLCLRVSRGFNPRGKLQILGGGDYNPIVESLTQVTVQKKS